MVKGLIVLIVAAVAFVVFALVDCLTSDRARIRSLNKGSWALVIVLLPVVGGILWFLLGRVGQAGTGRRTVAPDDDPDFLGRPAQPVSDADRESLDERIRLLEEDLAEHDDDGPTSTRGPKK
ncbi:Negative regulatory protein YxlE [Frondihabitans sp. 762G35]|uniref:PLD nuclease N-terminal domain-containing protein n=1 Tax=Frondihabitans sp. 762G35 TaxID=1446794 RepID=UPI000D20E77D|nr:PLD nuclease N-terminal domain-containing protein [Frondihabitans sp. 762G35]ARC57615.1 Negative regulatory protein YxlE [Frondihabitans sp. 762G35]